MSDCRHPNVGPINHLDQLQSVKEEWLDIYEGTSAKSPFLSFEFINLWYNCFAEPDQVRIYRAYDGRRTIGFLPLIIGRKKGIRVLASLTNDHCLHSGPLVRNGYDGGFPELMLKELLRDSHSWDVFFYSFSYSFSKLPGLFSDKLLNGSGAHWARKSEPTYVISLEKPFEEYFSKNLSRNVRNSLKRHRNRLNREKSFRVLHYRAIEALELWSEFVEIEGSGWKGEAGSSINRAAREFKTYYEGLVKLLARRDALNIHFLEVNGKNVAGVFGYVEGDTYHYAKIGYNEEFKSFSPSNLLILYIIEQLMRNFPDITRFHMFPWDYGYKHRYTNEEAFSLKTIIFSPTLHGKIIEYLYKSKKLLSRVPGAVPIAQFARSLLQKKDDR